MYVCLGHYMEMSSHFHDLDALRPRKEAMYLLNRRLNEKRKIFTRTKNRHPFPWWSSMHLSQYTQDSPTKIFY